MKSYIKCLSFVDKTAIGYRSIVTIKAVFYASDASSLRDFGCAAQRMANIGEHGCAVLSMHKTEAAEKQVVHAER